MTYARLRPNRSPSLLPIRMKAAETSASRATADWTPLTVVSRSSTTAEIETFMSDVSMTKTNIAIARRMPTLEFPVPACDDIADQYLGTLDSGRLQPFSAPRETRTPTPHKQDKALNLARLPIPPQARGTAEYRCRPIGSLVCEHMFGYGNETLVEKGV